MMQRRRTFRVKWFRLIVVTLSAYLIYAGVNQYNQLSAIQQEQAMIKLQLEQACEVNASLSEERKRLNDRAYIEKLAREELGLAKPGETLYMPADKN